MLIIQLIQEVVKNTHNPSGSSSDSRSEAAQDVFEASSPSGSGKVGVPIIKILRLKFKTLGQMIIS